MNWSHVIIDRHVGSIGFTQKFKAWMSHKFSEEHRSMTFFIISQDSSRYLTAVSHNSYKGSFQIHYGFQISRQRITDSFDHWRIIFVALDMKVNGTPKTGSLSFSGPGLKIFDRNDQVHWLQYCNGWKFFLPEILWNGPSLCQVKKVPFLIRTCAWSHIIGSVWLNELI